MKINTQDKISIIIPVYNLENYIEKCIKSVLEQTYENFELIIIDDGSMDKSQKLAQKFSVKDKRIIVFQQSNKGPSAARNLGIKNSTGMWITFIDADDHIDKTYLEQLISAIKINNSDLSLCKFATENTQIEDAETQIATFNNPEKIGKLLLKNMWKEKVCTFTTFGKLYKSEIIKDHNIYYDENLQNAEDLIFSIDYWNYVKSCSYINKQLYIHTKRKNSLSNQKVNIKDVVIGRKIFYWKLKDYFARNNLNYYLKSIKKVKYESVLIVIVDILRKLKIKN